MAEDLRTWWASASPGERDERVALALGWSIRPMLAVPSRKTWHDTKGHARSIPPYSTSWEHAASLLDRLNLDGWDYRLVQSTHGQPPYFSLFRTPEEGKISEIHTRGDTAPDAIALAFCLAKEASHG